MATAPRPTQPVRPTQRPVTATPAPTRSAAESAVAPEPIFLFGKENYMLMFGGLALIFLGFFLLSGGKSPNPHEFKYDEIYSFRRITLAPIVILIGFGVEVFAIMRRPKTASN